MMQILACFLSLTIIALTPSRAAAETSYRVRDAASPCLRVRDAPTSAAAAIECVAVGTVLVELGVAPFWRQVRLPDGRTGWASKRFLEITASPVPTPAPASTAIPSNAFLEVHFVDVGQGDGIWIH